MLSQWLETNATFEIRGRTLKGRIKEEHSNLAPLLRVLDSIFAIPFMTLKGWIKEEHSNLAPLLRVFDSIFAMFDSIFAILFMTLLVLLIWGPPLIIAILLPTRYRNTLNGSADTSGLPVILYIGIVFAVIISVPVSVHGCEFYRGEIRESKKRWDDWTHLVNPGKRLIVADKGFLGMVDDRALEGDILFNLVGCPESVVLRKVEGGRKRYVIVGECYVHLTPTDRDEYFGPVDKNWDASQQQAEKVKWLNGPRKWKLEEIELV